MLKLCVIALKRKSSKIKWQVFYVSLCDFIKRLQKRFVVVSECFRSDKAHTVNVLNNFKNKRFGKLIHIVILKNNIANQEGFYHILNHGYGTDLWCAFS